MTGTLFLEGHFQGSCVSSLAVTGGSGQEDLPQETHVGCWGCGSLAAHILSSLGMSH